MQLRQRPQNATAEEIAAWEKECSFVRRWPLPSCEEVLFGVFMCCLVGALICSVVVGVLEVLAL